MEIPGVNTNIFLKTSLNAIRKARGEKELDAIDFLKLVKEKAKELKFDEEKLLLNFHTDFRSPKILDLKKNNNSSFLFYDHSIKIQLRIKTLSSINNQNEIAKQSWDLTQLSSRKCYLTKKRPSSKTNIPEDGLPKHLQGIDPTKNESEGGYNNFAVIQNKIESIDWLYLSYSGHKRLSINFKNNIPEFSWLIP